MVPVVVIVPPVIGAVVAIDVTVPDPPDPLVSITAVLPVIERSPLLTLIVVIGLPDGVPPTVVTVSGGDIGPDINHHT